MSGRGNRKPLSKYGRGAGTGLITLQENLHTIERHTELHRKNCFQKLVSVIPHFLALPTAKIKYRLLSDYFCDSSQRLDKTKTHIYNLKLVNKRIAKLVLLHRAKKGQQPSRMPGLREQGMTEKFGSAGHFGRTK